MGPLAARLVVAAKPCRSVKCRFLPGLNASRKLPQIDVTKDNARFEGEITQDSATNLIAVLNMNSPPQRLVTSSGGRDGNAARRIAQALASRRIGLEVVGVCAYACANDLLPAASEVALNGVVMFHGSSGAGYDRLGPLGFWAQYGLQRRLLVWRWARLEEEFWRTHSGVRQWAELSGRPAVATLRASQTTGFWCGLRP